MDRLSIIWAKFGIGTGVALALIQFACGQWRWGLAYLLMAAWWAWTYRDSRQWWKEIKMQCEEMRAWGKIAGIDEPVEGD